MSNTEVRAIRYTIEELSEEMRATKQYLYAKEQELKRYRVALELIKNLSGAGMSYQDMVIECREIAKLAFDPDYDAILMGRYDEDSHKLFDILRSKGGKNE